jgi:hypothetical protein
MPNEVASTMMVFRIMSFLRIVGLGPALFEPEPIGVALAIKRSALEKPSRACEKNLWRLVEQIATHHSFFIHCATHEENRSTKLSNRGLWLGCLAVTVPFYVTRLTKIDQFEDEWFPFAAAHIAPHPWP